MPINQKRLVDEFIKLVKIDSESGEEQEIILYLKKELQKLGFKTFIDKTGNLIARNSEKPKLILSAHADTVKPGKGIKPIITKQGVIKTDGSTILGADNKVGISAIIETLKSFKENKQSVGLEIIFTVSEEVGVVGASNLDVRKTKSKQALILDSGNPESIVLAEPSIMDFEIEITGKASHAGINPEKGINAITIASEAISSLKWGSLDKDSTANVGVINGGVARNIIPERVNIKAEIRSLNDKKFKYFSKKLENEFIKITKRNKAKIKIKKSKDGFSYNVNKRSNLVKALIESYKKNKINFVFKKSRGATDANAFNRKGILSIMVNVGGDNIHSTKENLKIKDLVNGTKIIYDVVINLAREK